MRPHRFALALRDQLWSLDGHPCMLQERTVFGQAEHDGRDIHARDEGDEELLRRLEDLMSGLPAASTMRGGLLRLVASVRRVDDRAPVEEVHCGLSINSISIVTHPAHLVEDGERLAAEQARQSGLEEADLSLPMAWTAGSGSVLLHEAIGHAAEHGHEVLHWPSWLAVTDEPEAEIDDCGGRTERRDLTRGERPSAYRRSSFVERPWPRLSRLFVRAQTSLPELPANRIEINRIAGGSYDPLTEQVSISVASAQWVKEDSVRALAPFQMSFTRREVLRALRGAYGHVQRYPGVLCMREGQELFVGSFAPTLLTQWHA